MNEEPNINYIQQLSGGDIEFEEKMMSILKKELPFEIETYLNTLKINNLQQTAEIVHKIKHKISILGLEKSYQFTIQYEKELLEGNKSKHEDFLKILNTMSDFLTK
ncbi:Hpt domain-containing protein [Tenacibaculum sp. MEBiC06402]|uniref:Hpt domain-containing protein n=1 Tax=unclassified Tenacibaculum TaxID=2635139 RepID=UPI003B9AAFA1